MYINLKQFCVNVKCIFFALSIFKRRQKTRQKSEREKFMKKIDAHTERMYPGTAVATAVI